LASLKRNGIIIIMWQFLIPSKIPIVTLDCQVNQVMVMKTQEDTSQNLVSSNHNCDFPPNQKKQGNPAGQKNSRWTKAGVSKVHLLYPIAEKNRENSEISG
jgi:hypothetical protein